jgi:hypothetical protein
LNNDNSASVTLLVLRAHSRQIIPVAILQLLVVERY